MKKLQGLILRHQSTILEGHARAAEAARADEDNRPLQHADNLKASERKDAKVDRFLSVLREAIKEKKQKITQGQKMQTAIARETRSLTRKVMRFNAN